MIISPTLYIISQTGIKSNSKNKIKMSEIDSKNLSLNNSKFSINYDCRSQMQQSFKRRVALFVPDEKFAKPVEPWMCDLDDPAFRLAAVLNSYFFFASRTDMRDVAVIPHGFFWFFSGVPSIRAKMLLDAPPGFSDPIFQYLIHLRDIMSIRSGYDDWQRDPTLVYENMAFGSIFFPDQLDWVQLIPALSVLWSLRRRYFATSMQSPPSRHIQPAPFSKAYEKILPLPTFWNNDEYCWNYRILSAEPSTECQYGEHTLSLQRFCGVPSVCALLHVAFGNSFPDHVLLSESMLKLAPKIHLTLPKTLSPYSPPRWHDVNIAQFFVISTVI